MKTLDGELDLEMRIEIEIVVVVVAVSVGRAGNLQHTRQHPSEQKR